MKSLSIAVALGLSVAAQAAGWRYLVYENGALVYDGPAPPVDLSYPPPGEPTPFIAADSPLRGTLLTPAEKTARPHVVVIPPPPAGSVEAAPPLPAEAEQPAY